MKKTVVIIPLLVLLLIPTISVEASEVDSQFVSYTKEIGGIYEICPELIQSVIEKESSYDPKAECGGCIGLMQVNPKWHRERMNRLGVTDLTDPYSNILVGTDYLAELYEEAIEKGYGDDIYYVLMRYSMKADTANALWESAHYSDYALTVADRAVELEIEHGK